MNFPLSVSAHRDLIAYVYTEINEKPVIDEMLRSLDSSVTNQFVRDAAGKVISWCNKGYEAYDNILKVMKTSHIENQESFTCDCKQQRAITGAVHLKQLGNRNSVRVLDPKTFELLFEIVPPNVTAISICKLSDSGRYLLVGNEYGQYFFVYELFPPKCVKHTCKCLLPFRLIAVLFRGYTQTTVMDCVVSD